LRKPIQIDLSRCSFTLNALLFRSRQEDLIDVIVTSETIIEGVHEHLFTLITEALILYENAKEIIAGRVGYSIEEVSEIMYLRSLIDGSS
jgi:hypothetical protein